MVLRALRRFMYGLALVGVFLPLGAWAGTWDSMVFLDRTATSTLSGRLCIGTGGATIACPTFAPSLTTAGDMTLGGLLTAPNALITGDLRVGGNFYVSGTQTFDGVTFANGGISASTISVGSVSSPIVSGTYLYGQYVSGTSGYFAGLAVDTGTITSLGVGNMAMSGNLTGPVLVSTSAGGVVSASSLYAQALQAGTGAFSGDVNIAGNLNVSGSQTIDGVTFANGGISATRIDVGDISSTYVYGQYISGTEIYAAALTSGPASLASIGTGAIAMNGNLTGAPLISTSEGGLVSTTYLNAQVVSGTAGYFSADVRVAGNLYVSGSQSIDGVVFANGGISATRIDVGDVSSTYLYGQYISGTSGYFAGLAVDSGQVTSLGVGNMAVSGNITGPVLVSGSEGSTVSTTYLNAQIVSGTTGYFRGDVNIAGNLNVSGSQSIDGVVFANGGISATRIDVGDVSSTYVYGRYVSGTSGYFAGLAVDAGTVTSLGVGNMAVSGNITGPALVSGSAGSIVSSTYVNAQVISASAVYSNGRLYVESAAAILSDTVVSGTLKVSGDGTEGCTVADEGKIRVNPSTHTLQICSVR